MSGWEKILKERENCGWKAIFEIVKIRCELFIIIIQKLYGLENTQKRQKENWKLFVFSLQWNLKRSNKFSLFAAHENLVRRFRRICNISRGKKEIKQFEITGSPGGKRQAFKVMRIYQVTNCIKLTSRKAQNRQSEWKFLPSISLAKRLNLDFSNLGTLPFFNHYRWKFVNIGSTLPPCSILCNVIQNILMLTHTHSTENAAQIRSKFVCHSSVH